MRIEHYYLQPSTRKCDRHKKVLVNDKVVPRVQQFPALKRERRCHTYALALHVTSNLP